MLPCDSVKVECSVRRLSEPEQHHNVVVSMLLSLATVVENTVSDDVLVFENTVGRKLCGGP